MKKCHFCYTEIHSRASICPECQHPQTVIGRARGMIVTGFPIFTAVISIGFAGYEKMQTQLAESALAETANQLEVHEIRNEAAEEALIEMSKQLPQLSMLEEPAASVNEAGDSGLSPREQLEAFARRQRELAKDPQASRKEIKQIEQARLRLLQRHPGIRNGAISPPGSLRR